MRHFLLAVTVGLGILLGGTNVAVRANAPDEKNYDVVVYGGTSAGVIAAVQCTRMGKSVVLIEPSHHLGGLTSGGLGATDIGNKAAIGGLAREFYRRIGAHYAQDSAWKYQTRESYTSRRQKPGETEMWTFEPHVAEAVFETLVREARVPVVRGLRLDLNGGVERKGRRIVALRMEDGQRFRGTMFIDATYEGDLMPGAGVTSTIGRESHATYGETLNGVQVENAVHHQFVVRVDPYRIPGDPSSGLLPGIHGDSPGEEGSGDHRVQAYCYRLCTTDVPENRRPWPRPDDYDPLRYELLLRNFEAGDLRIPWNPVFMPNRKTDTNNNFAFSTDNIGANYNYPAGDYATRERIIAEHQSYQKGLMWTLANHPRVPPEVREHFQRVGLAKDEFVDNDNWPHQLYVREARRMVSDCVMTQHHCQGREIVDDPVGLAAYTMDSHHVQRFVKDGAAFNEGDVQVGGFAPYPIAYRSIRPRKTECENLLVPVCLSASHIAYGSIRMEPVFMVLGQSAATAAALAIDAGAAVQDVPYAKLRERLEADGQVLAWTAPRPKPPVEAASLPGIVVDDRHAELSGQWSLSRSVGGYVEHGYRHDDNANKGSAAAVFRPQVPKSGQYEVWVYYVPSSNRATNAPVTVHHAGGEHRATVNQQKPTRDGNRRLLGVFRFTAGDDGTVTVSNADTDGYVVIDAVQLVPVKE